MSNEAKPDVVEGVDMAMKRYTAPPGRFDKAPLGARCTVLLKMIQEPSKRYIFRYLMTRMISIGCRQKNYYSKYTKTA